VTANSDVIGDDVTTKLPASKNDADDDDTDDVDEHFRDAVYRSLKRSTLADRRRRPPSSMRRLLDRPAASDCRPEAVLYRPIRAPETDYRHGGCALCGDVTTMKWTSGSSGDVDDRPDLIDVCLRPQHCQTMTTSAHAAFAHCGVAGIR